MSSRSSNSLSDAGFVKDWYWALFLSFFLDRERFLDRLEVLGATPASVWPPLFRSDVGSEVGSVPREIDLAFRSGSDGWAVGAFMARNAEDSVGRPASTVSKLVGWFPWWEFRFQERLWSEVTVGLIPGRGGW